MTYKLQYYPKTMRIKIFGTRIFGVSIFRAKIWGTRSNDRTNTVGIKDSDYLLFLFQKSLLHAPKILAPLFTCNFIFQFLVPIFSVFAYQGIF